MTRLRELKFSVGMLSLLILLITQCSIASAQGTEAYFNGTSYALLSKTLNLQGRTSLSFRTCSSGQLVHQNGLGNDFIELALLPSSQLQLRWEVHSQQTMVLLGHGLINNRWHDVDLIYNLGTVTLTVDKQSVLVANSTYHSDLFNLQLESSHSMVFVGRGYTGCILQGAGVVLNVSSIESYSVSWGKCPLPDKGDCDGYLVDHCFSQPCHKLSQCMTLSESYKCVCTTRYSGSSCDIDLGPLCEKPEHNQCQNGGVCREDETGNSTSCICLPKFTGTYCETRIDNTFCDTQPCRNGGTCNINQFRDNYICSCPQGFAGVDCELNIDECQSFPCQNNGSCTDEINSYTCDCTGTGYRGHNCDININECRENDPCYTGSMCFDRYGDYMCDCPPGFGGKNCDQEVNECDSSPCHNAGSCMDNLNGYLCNCVLGFAGINCEINIDDCFDAYCPNNTHCVDGMNTFSCVCNPGYTGAVPHCVEINECASGPCLNGGTCHDGLSDFSCSCVNGFIGRFCEVNVDECASNPCINGATCTDGVGQYICECVPGFTGMNCDVDINECDPNPCQNSIRCTDMVNDYFCECIPGWEGKTCDVNFDECVSKPCLHGSCLDLLNNFTCSCDPGYSGQYCEENINECDSSPCFNGGTCTDLVANFSCQCAREFMGKTCAEVYNACYLDPCENGGSCQTISPSHEYTCICPHGFDGQNCEINIDECKGIVCPQGQMCFDMVNTYECRCPAGFSGSDCSINTDECSSNPCVNGTCVDGIGNYVCDCLPGFTGSRCEMDIDECESSPCMNGGFCQNLPGSFLCYCRPGFTSIRCNIEFNECLSAPCKNNATCNDLVNNYSCSCLPGFTGHNCETDINECEPKPCQNGATCSDLINRYECTCIPGFSGVNCEVNIDECAASPCANGGACIDLINKFECNCTDSGFTGVYCETNIDDCVSNPCTHGSSCEDGIKDYHCHCYNGYEGENCEIDIPECTSSPCLNSALCLEYSNTTLYDMNYLGFFPSFSYDRAGGYRCICSSGFTGINCETNIDDCEVNACSTYGTCIDKINDYYCACSPGYEGQYCGTEINECEQYEPCQNGASCEDLIDDYSCSCPPNFGDKNCSTFLQGCNDNKCENNATCKPLLLEDGSHGYICLCPSGYKGNQCEKLTTVSFQGDGMWNLKPSSFRFENYVLDLHFRTTLPDGIIAQGFMPEPPLEYILYLWKSYVYLGVYNNTGLVAEVASRRGQNDSFWKHIVMTFNSDEVMLNVSGKLEQSNISRSLLFNFYTVMGASSPDMTPAKRYLTKSIPQFVGCIQDVLINDEVEIPDFLEMKGGIELGCPREEQCGSSACMNGRCQDNWISYECICSRPYFGKHCEYSHVPATFGYMDQASSAQLNIPYEVQSNISDVVEVSFFLRTRKSDGLVFYLGSLKNDPVLYSEAEMPNNSFMVARLFDGKLQVVLKLEYANPEEVLLDRKLDDGEVYLIQVSKNRGVLSLSANDSITSKPVPNYSLEAQVLYISGFPESLYRQKRQLTPMITTSSLVSYTFHNVTHFKGVIQDFRINNMVVVFYPLNDSNAASATSAPAELGRATMTLANEGVISDNLCQLLNPCFHGAPCNDVWNEYTCDCPKGYRGKDCDEEEPCNKNTCPENSECQNLLEGYECVAPASFNGNDSSIQYKVHGVTGNITNITFLYRSKDVGTILWLHDIVSFSGYFLHVELLNDSIDVKWDFGNPPGTTKTVSQKIEDDGEWQRVEILFKETFVQLNLNGKVPMLSEDTYLTTLDKVLNNQSNLYLGFAPEGGHYFKGCMKEVRINGNLLPFFQPHLIPDTGNPFSMHRADNIKIGCILCWNEDCVHGICYNETESYACDCSVGYEGQFCTVDMCNSRMPCKNGGLCYHTQDGIMCECTDGFTGDRCSIQNLCASHPCQNNGQCIHDIERNDYNCTCTEEFEGKNCDRRTIIDCTSYPCEHGTCVNMDTDSPLKYECLCDERHEGQNCDQVKDLCESNPCTHNGICVMNEEQFRYHCECKPGYEGAHCEIDINECESGPCVFGECIDEVNAYTCACYPGYHGRDCEHKQYRCEGKVCFNGTCQDTEFGYECSCAKGYFGKHCNVHDDCTSAICNERGQCNPLHDETERYFDFNCSCTEGYSGKSCAEKLSVSGDDDTSLILMILIPVMCLFILCLLIGAIIFLRMAKKKRATRGTYSPSRQEMFGSRVEMNHVMKPPPEERLI